MRNRARPKHNRQKRTHRMYSSDYNEARFDHMWKALAELEEFKGTVAPFLQNDLKNGLTAKEMREKYKDLLTARVITDALKEKDPAKALAAIKDLLDRTEGKATEKKEVKHTFADLKDEELDAILKSEIEELEEMQARFEQ